MSEKQLAEMLDLKPPYLNAIASGKKNVTINQLERIADALGMTLYIAFEEPPKRVE
jgi:transcriptional regulator with XRE-family HTH domain